MPKVEGDSINCIGQVSGVKNRLRKIGEQIVPFKVIEVSIPVHQGGLTDEHRLLADEFFEDGSPVRLIIEKSQKELDLG
jgi:hypothetical protein